MKRKILMSVLLCMTLLTACGTKNANQTAAVNETTAVEENTVAEVASTVEETTAVNDATTVDVSTSANAGKSQVNVSNVVQVSNTAATQNSDEINTNLQNMKIIFRAVTGYMLEGTAYDSSNNSEYWKILCYATTEYVIDYGIEDLDGNLYNNYYKVTPDIIGELAYVLFPNRPDYTTVNIPTFSSLQYASYDETTNTYDILIGELGTLGVEIGDYVINEDGSLTVTVKAISRESGNDWNKTLTYTLVNNEDAANSDFAYAIKDVTMSN